MKVLNADFVTSAAAGGRANSIPHDGLAQIALAGRSNVGKSSLINALCRRKIARTSAAPGKTRLANIYRVTLEGVPRLGSGQGGTTTRELYLVDLPGYGYARGGGDAANELAAVAEGYFRSRDSALDRARPSTGSGRPELVEARDDPERVEGSGSGTRRSVRLKPDATGSSEPRPAALLLIDSRHPGLESDIAAHSWLASMDIEPHIVATKIDKLSRAERTRNLKTLGNIFGTAALPVSAQSGEGLNELWQLIIRLARNR